MLEQKPREIAFHVLKRREAGVDYVENLLDSELAGKRLSPADRGLCVELVYGAVRWQATLDWLISRKTGGRTQKIGLQILLRLGFYQMFWLERIPDHAIVNETVDIAKRLGFGSQSGFVNALLRGYAREREETTGLLQELKNSNPATGFSHPQWLWERWEKRWGREGAAKLMEWNNAPPKTYARVNTLRAEPAKVIEEWRNEAVVYDFTQFEWINEQILFELKEHKPLARLKSFEQGLFYIQDPSTLLAVRMLGPRPGDVVLDLCAAPGGKATFIAQCMNNQGRVVAQDNQPERLKLIQENAARLGASIIEVGTPKTPIPLYDKVLVDAPCSNTGVMRRRVDLRWRIRPEEIDRLQRTQLELLDAAGRLLKTGGTMVYSTCSVEPEENQGVVEEFLKRYSDFRLESQRDLIPFRESVDGAFVAKIVKSS